MTMTNSERVQKYRQRKRMRSIDVTDDTLSRLKEYQERWQLPSLSVAVKHAVIFANESEKQL